MLTDAQLIDLRGQCELAIDRPVIRFVDVDPRVLLSLVTECSVVRMLQRELKRLTPTETVRSEGSVDGP